MKRTCKLTFWLVLFVILLAACTFVLSLAADANAEMPASEQVDPYELPEDAGEVILDDPALFMTVEDDEEAIDQESIAEPADTPVQESTTEPTDTPTQEPTTEPTDTPAQEPTTEPTDTPAQEPTIDPTDTPTQEPTTEPTDTPTQEPTTEPTQEPTPPPLDPETLFSVSIKTPDWRNSGAANVRIIVTPLSDQAWKSVLYRMGDESWTEITGNFYAYEGAYYCDVEITENAKMTVRLATENDGSFDISKDIRVFDYKPPVVTAGFREKILHVEAPDDLSGVAGIQVNGLLFTTLEDGKLDVQMEEPLNSYKQLAIRGYDYAGNFSDPVTLDNPYYIEPTPKPTNTPKPTKKPSATAKPTKKPSSSSSSSSNATAAPVPTATATPVPTAEPTQNPLISVVTPAPTAVAIATPETVTQTVYVPIGPGQPYQQDGNMQTLDMLYSAATNKQFITVQTRAGETYFLIIDYDKPIDEENEIYETYFLNLVDDHDLLSVIEDESLLPTPTPQIVYVTPEPTEAPRATPIPIADDDETDMGAMALLLIGVAAIGGAGLWFFKSHKKDKAGKAVPDYDEYEFEEDEDSEEEM